jgi:hypothetical protein
MSYLAIKDLKKTRMVREKLDRERELVLTKDGVPFALVVGVEPDAVEESNIRPDGIITSIAALPGWIETAA